MPTGTIRRLFVTKGFGFIRDEQGTDHFFHMSAIRGGSLFSALKEGQRVEFVPVNSARGPRAGEVRVVDRARVA